MSTHLSSETRTRLIPLLGSLARLLAEGAHITDDHLEILLEAADLEADPSAQQELQRWVRLLRRLQTMTEASTRQTVVEALIQRGLPEATVLLAVSTVAGTAAAPSQPTPSVPHSQPTPSVPPLCLSVSPERLEWTNLPPDQPVVAELVVQGGPGRIVVDSDQVQVTPPQVGSGTTRVQVQVKPVAGGLIVTEIQVITASETIAVPVVASFRSEQPAYTAPPVQGTPWSEQPTRVPAPPAVSLPPAVPRTPATPAPPPDPVRAALDAGRWQDALIHLRPRVAQGEDAALLLLAGFVETAAVPLALRMEAAGLLGVNDPRLLDPHRGTNRFNTYWCPIEAGLFWAGSHLYNEPAPPLRQMALPTRYQIARYPVTNAEYARFMAAGGYREQRWWTPQGWIYVSPKGEPRWDKEYKGKAITQPRHWQDAQRNAPTQPVVGVSWYEAAAYCAWLTEMGQTAGWLPRDAKIRLPTSREWERAARHTDRRTYPWGNAITPEHANSRETGLRKSSPVGCFPAGAAGCGALDMSGNVWEWTATPHAQPEQISMEKDVTPYNGVVLRGGGYGDDASAQSCGSRGWGYAFNWINGGGFRVVWSLRSSE